METLLGLLLLSAGLPDFPNFNGHWVGPGERVTGANQVAPCEHLDWKIAQFPKVLRISPLTAICGGEKLIRPGIEAFIRGNLLHDSTGRTLGMFDADNGSVTLSFTQNGSLTAPPQEILLQRLPDGTGISASFQIFGTDGQSNEIRGQLQPEPSPEALP